MYLKATNSSAIETLSNYNSMVEEVSLWPGDTRGGTPSTKFSLKCGKKVPYNVSNDLIKQSLNWSAFHTIGVNKMLTAIIGRGKTRPAMLDAK